MGGSLRPGCGSGGSLASGGRTGAAADSGGACGAAGRSGAGRRRAGAAADCGRACSAAGSSRTGSGGAGSSRTCGAAGSGRTGSSRTGSAAGCSGTGRSRTRGTAGSGRTAACGECHNQLLSGRRRRIFRQPDSLDRGTGRNGQHLRDPQRTGICLLEDFRSGGSSVCGRVRGDYRLFGFLKTVLRCGDFPGLCIGLFRIRLGWNSRV